MTTNERDLSYYLGVDPGKTGAFALYQPYSKDIIFFDMPLKSDPNKKTKKIIDLFGIATWIDSHARLVRHAMIEKPMSFPGEGRTSGFNFGFNCGVVQMAVASALIPMELITPPVWKKRMELTRDKKETIEAAKKLIPFSAPQLTLVKHHGRAEALLLAHLLFEDIRDGKINKNQTIPD